MGLQLGDDGVLEHPPIFALLLRDGHHLAQAVLHRRYDQVITQRDLTQHAGVPILYLTTRRARWRGGGGSENNGREEKRKRRREEKRREGKRTEQKRKEVRARDGKYKKAIMTREANLAYLRTTLQGTTDRRADGGTTGRKDGLKVPRPHPQDIVPLGPK